MEDCPTGEKKAYLFDAWLTAGEDWKKSKLLEILRSKTGSRKRGIRKWLTFDEMEQKWGKQIAQEIREAKLNDPDLKARETRDHPDLPKNEARS